MEETGRANSQRLFEPVRAQAFFEALPGEESARTNADKNPRLLEAVIFLLLFPSREKVRGSPSLR